MTHWHLKGFWARPARCSTKEVVFIYTASPESKLESLNWTIELVTLGRKEDIHN